MAKSAGHEVVRLPVGHCELNPISNVVALLSRIHPQTKWLPRLLQPCYTGKKSSYAYQTL
uniref:Uncharacterized protein n=1 Tax=Amphimedon queenslandica TaxID=400682 RepID=A0A1X7VJS2_AMPQE